MERSFLLIALVSLVSAWQKGLDPSLVSRPATTVAIRTHVSDFVAQGCFGYWEPWKAEHSGGLWIKLEDDHPVFGFRVEPHHCNPIGCCHGGMLLTFIDSYLPNVPLFGPEGDDGETSSVSITTDFLAPAKLLSLSPS